MEYENAQLNFLPNSFITGEALINIGGVWYSCSCGWEGYSHLLVMTVFGNNKISLLCVCDVCWASASTQEMS